jgi:hypothetical protein
MAGKKTMGTAKPGNNSGDAVFKGRVNAIGMITPVKDRIEKRKLKTISPFLGNRDARPQYIKAATRQIITFNPSRLLIGSTVEKSASVAKK